MSLTDNDKRFLLSFKAGKPDWTLINIERLQHLPAVKWKLLHIQKLATNSPVKHQSLLDKLCEALYNAS